ncbi:MAG: autotransporter assembly complex protein TamA [Arenimonas sp.]|uniref:autotransporter assembly complex protein TamA n=1 Tax=Arenimonas sp. TaxID=1872635 RepID=UPI0025BDC493|nr:autotransporter assembly complex family protein [Arenimonas sp.]MBW8369219.1 autotransporter assembly complex protein TamA [Arenimonas sp.]
MLSLPPVRKLTVVVLSTALLAGAPDAARALELRTVTVQGLADEEMRDNVDDALSLQRLNPNRRASLSETRLSYLLRQVPSEVRQALEPFGYYEPTVDAQVQRTGETVSVVVVVQAGTPVKVRGRSLAITGAGRDDSALVRRLQRFRPREGQPFHHGVYEDSKATMDRLLAERGYFDAVLQTHTVTVNRAEHAADIDLAWVSGDRHALGAASFQGHDFRPGLLENLIPWKPGDPYDQRQLLALQTSLAELDYFSAIDVTPQPDDATDLQVPVSVALAMAKQSIYSAGVRAGTDSGLGVTGGVERRWINDRGHKLKALASLAQRRNDVTVQYKIPAFAWLDGWYAVSASVREEPVDEIESQLVELVGSRSGKLGPWDLVAAMNVRRERYRDSPTGVDYLYSNLVFPSLWAQWSRTDDLLYPRRALGVTMEVRGGSSALGSDIDFLQFSAKGQWVHGFGRRDRLLLRAEAGTTLSDDFAEFPPSLRFYAGGDRSVRGYAYREIGEQFETLGGDRYVVGGKHLAVASVEYERMFTRQWGGAVFVDAGDAFDRRDDFKAELGVGVGVRWRSPVGPVRVDIARGLGDAAGSSLRLHFNIGPDL